MYAKQEDEEKRKAPSEFEFANFFKVTFKRSVMAQIDMANEKQANNERIQAIAYSCLSQTPITTIFTRRMAKDTASWPNGSANSIRSSRAGKSASSIWVIARCVRGSG
jgi:hypothetical protein